MARFEEERRAAALDDLIRCPGLFACFYDDLDLLRPEWVEQRYVGAAGFMGLPKVYPTDAALAALEEMA